MRATGKGSQPSRDQCRLNAMAVPVSDQQITGAGKSLYLLTKYTFIWVGGKHSCVLRMTLHTYDGDPSSQCLKYIHKLVLMGLS